MVSSALPSGGIRVLSSGAPFARLCRVCRLFAGIFDLVSWKLVCECGCRYSTVCRSKISVPRVWLLILAFCFPLAAQDFEIQQPGQKTATIRSQSRKGAASTGLGWGSNIEVSRQARAAETALKNGDYSTGVAYAEQAANAAPQDYH